jgi:hypothetical protein
MIIEYSLCLPGLSKDELTIDTKSYMDNVNEIETT